MGSLVIVEMVVFRVVPRYVDFFLFGGSEEPLGKGVVRGSSYPGEGEIGTYEGKEILGYERSVRRSTVYTEFRLDVCFSYPLILQPFLVNMGDVRGID